MTERGTRRRTERRQQLPEDVAAYVRELIISGRVTAGDFLRTEPIAAAVGVSNTPVREGLLLLAGEGLVDLVPRRGFRVNPFTAQDVTGLFWAQAELAGELARRAAGRITDDDLRSLRAVVGRHAAALAADDAETTERCGHEFHRCVNLAAGSPRLATLLGGFVRQLPNRFYNGIEGRHGHTMDAHPRIIDALVRRDGAAAAALMRAHIMSGADDFLATHADQDVHQH
ncbi:GntR family transcriptional regulator [Gordonia sp. FQ]|uniref:GntR family transcriptional regulator n=1 Tax=Gordonia sp. FQ TaxID=3446634 RepID=UPI003F86D082